MGILRRKKLQVSKRPRVAHIQTSSNPKPVFSYYANRQDGGDTRSRQQKPSSSRQYSWHHIPTILAIAAIIISLGYLLGINTNPRITVLGQSSGQTLLRAQNVYQQAAQHFLADSIFNRTKITINTGAFAQNMKKQFPELSSVSITLPLMGHRPIVEIALSQPALILVSNQGSYVVDLDGRAVMSTSETHNISSLGLPKISDQNTAKTQLGSGVLPNSDVTFIIQVIAQLKAKNLIVESLTLPAAADELHLKLKDQPYFIKFNTQLDSRQSAGTYLALKQKLDTDHVTPVEYVDVRVEGKAYYK